MSPHMDVLNLMDSKKRCLRRYLGATEAFLASAERDDLSTLDSFERERERILKVLALVDRRIEDAVRATPLADRTPELAGAVRERLDEEAALIQRILAADTRIVTCIEREKRRLHRELASSQRSKELAGRFKSAWVSESGEELDKTI